jgi:hypothetical protein
VGHQHGEQNACPRCGGRKGRSERSADDAAHDRGPQAAQAALPGQAFGAMTAAVKAMSG